MKKLLFYFFAFVISPTILNAQEKVFETEKAFLNPEYNSNHSFVLPNQKNGDFMLILEGSNTLQGILLDKDYNEKKRVFAKALPSKFQYILGYTIENDTYSVLFTNKIHTKFGVIQFNIKNSEFLEKKIKLKLSNERFLESVVVDNKVYVLTIQRNMPHIIVYSFDQQFNHEKHIISLEKLEIALNKDSKIKKRIYHHFMDETENIPKIDLAKIDPNSPIPIEIAAHKKKLYLHDDKISLTFDHNNGETIIANLDIKNYTSSFTSIDKPKIAEHYARNSNSFIVEDTIFFILSFKDQLLLQIRDLLSNSVIKEFYISNEDNLIFSNASIIKEKKGKNTIGLSVDNTKETDISYFLKQMNSHNPGISVFKKKKQYAITLGATKKINYNALKIISGIAAVTPIGPALQIAQFGNVAVSVGMNPNLYMFSSYKATRSTHFSSLFNDKFEYLNKVVPLNDFDILGQFENGLKNPKAVNIFRNKKVLHYNYFDKKDGEFKLFKFE